MTKLISSVAAVVLGIATVASAGQGAMGKAAEKARDKAVKTETAGKQDRANRRVYDDRRDVRVNRRDLKADEKELKRLRKDLKDFHAGRLGEIMAAAGYGTDDIARVGSLVRKERLKLDVEAQVLEDIVCVVFLEHYIDGFMAKTDREKLADILAKTWAKMSPVGHEHALKLALAPAIPRLLEQGLARQRG